MKLSSSVSIPRGSASTARLMLRAALVYAALGCLYAIVELPRGGVDPAAADVDAAPATTRADDNRGGSNPSPPAPSRNPRDQSPKRAAKPQVATKVTAAKADRPPAIAPHARKKSRPEATDSRPPVVPPFVSASNSPPRSTNAATPAEPTSGQPPTDAAGALTPADWQGFSMDQTAEPPEHANAGGTEAEAVTERRRLMQELNRGARSVEEFRWRLDERPAMPRELRGLTQGRDKRLSKPLRDARLTCRGGTRRAGTGDRFDCLIEQYDKVQRESADAIMAGGQTSGLIVGGADGVPASDESDCRRAYGYDLIRGLRRGVAHMCTPRDAASGSSRLDCMQLRTHRMNEIDTSVCWASNASVSFDAMPPGEFPWLDFQVGALAVGDCAKMPEEERAKKWKFLHCTRDWMDLGLQILDSKIQLDSAVQGAKTRRVTDDRACSRVEERPTIFITRSGDYSPFAAAHDWVNTVTLMAAAGLSTAEVHIVLVDRMTVGFYSPMWRLAFAPQDDGIEWFPDLRESDQGMRMCYRRAYFNIPARLSPLYNFDTCRGSPLLRFTSDWLLMSVGALDVAPPPGRVVVTIILRKNYRTGHPIGRRIANSDAIAETLRKLSPRVVVNVIDYAFFDFDQQAAISRATDVLVGMHGAGLIQMLFLPPTAQVFEFFCPERPSSNTRYQQLSMRLSLGYASYSLDADTGVVPPDGVEQVAKLVKAQLNAKARPKQ